MTDGGLLLRASGLGKSYGAPVLRDVEIDLRAGEIHALVGENGAGKSTLSRILSGIIRPDTGTMALAGEPYAPKHKADAEAKGVGIVLQELNTIGTLSVAEQLQLRRFPHRGGFIDRPALDARARDALALVGLEDLDPRRPMAALGVAQQQLVAIAAELGRERRLLILDEPTSALSEEQAADVLARIVRHRAPGAALIYISHRLDEVLRIADRITILRDGRVVGVRESRQTSAGEIVQLMAGRDVAAVTAGRRVRATEPLLRVTSLSAPPMVHDVGFELRRGEVLGLAGLMGSGRTETVRALCGANRAASGEVWLHGRDGLRPFGSPREAARHGIAFVTENRKEEGLLLPLSVAANISLPSLPSLSRFGFVRRRTEQAMARRWVDRLGIAGVRSLAQPVASLSGGNQQKVVLAKWLERRPRVLVCDEPTRGIDVAARAAIHELLLTLAAEGCGVIVVSSEVEELMAICDRIVVLSLGRVAGTFERGAWGREAILAAAFTGHRRAGRHDAAAGEA